ncbi:Transcriptional regulatory protein, C terminal [Microbispora rosea]|uniref:Transcriptional regulatory protein, C terminal n=1 Tax=Microbispora rosea TaxID=58117 RepID=A0A1N7FK81_9ACTN|nr:BTAD domain-containing putative transcriptional regulator [Microbispora rosea]GIH50340.1 ATPase AAA [Microbispora rosea subsp. rosea]SIS00645.1 Transcriptional regulatory protein, C terminal [Microbispora rosea]
MVRVLVLGHIGAEVAGRPVELGTSLHRAVMARLVCAQGHIVSTDRFVDDLWKGQPPPKALGALQVYVSNLRRVLEPERAPRTPARVLVSAPPGYRLALGTEDVDAWLFPKLVDTAAGLLSRREPAAAFDTISEALSLWTGQAYEEFADQEWAVPEVGHLLELRAVATEYRAEAGLALGRHAELVPELERHVAAHPLRENAVRLLALSYYRAGRQGDALAALRRTRALLSDELGVDPGPALRSLEADILAQAPSLDLIVREPAPAPPVVPPDRPRPPSPGRMVGRTRELARLAAAAEQAGDGFRVAWLGGEAGLGKSTLADALVGHLSSRGWRTIVGRCPETTGGVPPAWAWSEVLRDLAATTPPPPETAARLAPLLTDDAVPVGQFWLARAVGDYLDGVPGPLLIVLEDVHRADEETLQLLRHLAVRLAATPVLVLLTHRPGESGAGLMATAAALAVQTVENMELSGLAPDEVARMLTERSGLDVDQATVRKVSERTGGNPLFVSETARLLAIDGPSAVNVLPPGVRDLIRRRVARLPGAVQATLRNAAVLGREVDADVLIAMPGADEETVLDGLEAGVLAGLLEEPRPGRVRFAHVLVRETLYEDIPRLRRARMHRKVVTALEAVRPGDVGALGHHALAAATTATATAAAEYASRAAAQASALYAHRDAAAFLDGGLGALDLASDPPEALRLDLMCRLVSAFAHAGEVERAFDVRAKALTAARRTTDPKAVARAAVSFDAPVIWTVQPERRLDRDLVHAVEDAIPRETGELRCLLLVTLCHAVEGHDAARVESASTEAVDIARAVGDPQLLCMALNARYWACHAPDRRQELEELGHELLRVSTAAGLLGYRTLGHAALCMVALGRNDWAAARRHADQAAEHSTSGQLGHALGILAFLDALHLLVRGEFDEAERAYTTLGERLMETGASISALMGAVGRFAVRLAAGRFDECVEALAPVWVRIPEEVAELYARALVAAGRLEEARAVWPAALPRRDFTWTGMMAARSATAIALEDRETAEACYRLLLSEEGEMAGLSTASVTFGPVAHSLGDLAVFLGEPEAAEGHYARAVEVARQVGSPHWEKSARDALAGL